ncbi:MAG: molybdopterin molybdotransferase MoeA [Methanomicrobiales archaeon]|nr:molybdopterin molybdotransferase MoeA [Methanomicrobiales archaeon]MDI6876121.1 molybdopterin molybdotransferase MoeA [Methanomicrobiales archaeon]
MSVFLRVVAVEKAIEVVRSLAPPPKREVALLPDAAGRILAEDARSDIDIPGFHRSIVDGYAVAARDTHGASEAIPAVLTLAGEVVMGRAPEQPIRRGECAYIPTGGMLPPGADAVAMIEHAERIGGDVLVKRAVAAGENVLGRGEDFAAGATAIPRGTRLGPQELGVLAAIGYAHVPVTAAPEIGILSTGNELVSVSAKPGIGQVRDANSSVCSGFVREYGCIPRCYGIVPDSRESLRRALIRAVGECDAVLVSGGSSKDERDMVASVIGEIGEVLVHGVALQPGKPTIIGHAEGKPVIGLPGHPASAFVVLVAIASHLLSAMTGYARRPCTVTARLRENIPSSRGREEYVRVRVENGEATPLFGKSGLLNTLVRSDGAVRVPAGSEGFEAGVEVEVLLW